MNKELLRYAVIDVLHNARLGVPERTIMLGLNGVLRLRATYTQLRETLQNLEEDRHIVSVTAGDGMVLWRITDNGEAVRAEFI